MPRFRPSAAPRWDCRTRLIRLSPGIEHAADLIDDLRAGLHDVAAARAKSIVICA